MINNFFLANFIFRISVNSSVSSDFSVFDLPVVPEYSEIIYINEKTVPDERFFATNGYELCATASITGNDNLAIEEVLYHLCANVLLTKGVLHLHSSFVLYKDKALVFTGPSGIGKTTQAELWRDFQGALIVNGDACLLRRMEDGWHAFGTPVHGSSPYCENREAPLSALVVLKQGKENRLERLDAFSALSECLPEFYRPRMDPETEDTFWKAADSLFREIPVYKLTCRPDRKATELVKETIFGA